MKISKYSRRKFSQPLGILSILRQKLRGDSGLEEFSGTGPVVEGRGSGVTGVAFTHSVLLSCHLSYENVPGDSLDERVRWGAFLRVSHLSCCLSAHADPSLRLSKKGVEMDIPSSNNFQEEGQRNFQVPQDLGHPVAAATPR